MTGFSTESETEVVTALRLTKYDPRFRNESGHYLQSTWTSMSDIGRDFPDGTLTSSEYIAVEDKFVAAISLLASRFDASGLTICDFEQCPVSFENLGAGDGPDLRSQMKEFLKQATTGMALTSTALELATRLSLREAIWCRITGKNGFYIHFGYDFYVYIGANIELPFEELAIPEGLFLEHVRSPYWDEGDIEV